jgi:hypothetical protein
METIRIRDQFDVDVFNSLGTVEDADREIRQDDRLQAYLHAASELFLAHNMQSRFGVSLLHKHDDCAEGEHMIEFEENFAGETSLVSRPITQTPSQAGAAPVVWMLRGSTLFPLEYSTDQFVSEIYAAGSISDKFLGGFAALAESSLIAKCFGLAIARRKFNERAKPGEGAIEFTGLGGRCNVVRLRPRAEYENRAIQTVWTFGDDENDKGCDRSCFIDGSGNHVPHHKPK